jgi:hypothetical protein
MEIKTTAIEKALRLLTASGASFHVQLGNQEWGTAMPRKAHERRLNTRMVAVMAHIKPYMLTLRQTTP